MSAIRLIVMSSARFAWMTGSFEDVGPNRRRRDAQRHRVRGRPNGAPGPGLRDTQVDGLSSWACDRLHRFLRPVSRSVVRSYYGRDLDVLRSALQPRPFLRVRPQTRGRLGAQPERRRTSRRFAHRRPRSRTVGHCPTGLGVVGSTHDPFGGLHEVAKRRTGGVGAGCTVHHGLDRSACTCADHRGGRTPGLPPG